jgi:methanogenic corrinoid protein MtbC1
MEEGMASAERNKEIIEGIRKAVIDYDDRKCAELCTRALEEGVDAQDAVTKGLMAGMERAGELYAGKEYFVPELLMCSDALYAGLAILKPRLTPSGAGKTQKMILGVVEGDIHDIGKNLVRAMFEGAGWMVHDLGKNVKLERFAEEQQKIKADIIGISALMTTSMLAIPKVIEMIRAKDGQVKIIVGGAPLNRSIAHQFGADGYSPDARSAIQEAAKLVEGKTA